MPLAFVLCDDDEHKGEHYSFEECLACAKQGGPRHCHSSYQLIKAMSLNSVERRDAGLSATMLIDKCPRKLILQAEYDYGEHPSEMWSRVRGTVHHLLIEHYSEGLEPYIAEQRFKRSIEVMGHEIVITGKPDMILPERKLIIDYKSIYDVFTKNKSVRNGEPMPEHVEQVNVYRWIVADGEALGSDIDDKSGSIKFNAGDKINVDIDFGGIQYLDMMNQYKCAVPIWSLEKTEQFIIEKLEPLVLYEMSGELPPILYNKWGERDKICNYCPVREFCDARGN